jgi:hypothetical protein
MANEKTKWKWEENWKTPREFSTVFADFYREFVARNHKSNVKLQLKLLENFAIKIWFDSTRCRLEIISKVSVIAG